MPDPPQSQAYWVAQQTPPSFPQTSSQAQEDTERPTIDATLPPMIQPSDMTLWPDGCYHFVTPHFHISFGESMDTKLPAPKHPDYIDARTHWLWMTFCMIERSGLLAGLDGPTSAYDAISEAAQCLCDAETALAKGSRDLTLVEVQGSFIAAMAVALSPLATRLRRCGVEKMLVPLEGGRRPEEPTFVFKSMTDILRREPPVKVMRRFLSGPRRADVMQIKENTLMIGIIGMNFALEDRADVMTHRHESYISYHIGLVSASTTFLHKAELQDQLREASIRGDHADLSQ
jgi:hypothetical protein